MSKKVIKLINNERENSKLALEKACDTTSIDSCLYEDHDECVKHSEDTCRKDYAGCRTYAIDVCITDYASCAEGATDHCASFDTDLCIGPGTEDTF